MGFLGQVNSLSIQREVRVMEPGNPLNGTDVGGSLGSERGTWNLPSCLGVAAGSTTPGERYGPKNVLRGKLGHESLCKKQNFYGPPSSENNDPIPLTR